MSVAVLCGLEMSTILRAYLIWIGSSWNCLWVHLERRNRRPGTGYTLDTPPHALRGVVQQSSVTCKSCFMVECVSQKPSWWTAKQVGRRPFATEHLVVINQLFTSFPHPAPTRTDFHNKFPAWTTLLGVIITKTWTCRRPWSWRPKRQGSCRRPYWRRWVTASLWPSWKPVWTHMWPALSKTTTRGPIAKNARFLWVLLLYHKGGVAFFNALAVNTNSVAILVGSCTFFIYSLALVIDDAEHTMMSPDTREYPRNKAWLRKYKCVA